MKEKTDNTSVIFILLATCCYGLMPIFSELGYRAGFSPLHLVFIRFFGGPLLIYLFYLLTGKVNKLNIGKKQILSVLLFISFPYWVTIASKQLAFIYIPKGVCQAIFYVYPFYVILYTELFVDKKFDIKPLLCYIVIFIGVILTIDLSDRRITFFGVLLSIISSVAYAAYVICLKNQVFKEVGSVELSFYSMLFGLGFSTIVAPFTGFHFVSFKPIGWAAILGLVLISSIASMALFNKGIKKMNGGVAAMICSMEPVVTIIIETFSGLGHYSPRQYIGILFIPMGICLQFFSQKLIQKGENK